MGTPIIEKWKQQGDIWIWRYIIQSKNYAGLHFTADSAACKSFKHLIRLMKEAQWPSTKILLISAKPFIDPTGYGYKKTVLKTIKIKYRKNLVAEDHWQIDWDGTKRNPTLSLGAKKLNELEKGVSDVEKGYGDYSIGPVEKSYLPDMSLWFWWHTQMEIRKK